MKLKSYNGFQFLFIQINPVRVLSKDSKLEASNLFLNVVSSHEYLDELKPEYQKSADIEDNTIRLSIGLEDPHDLIEDLQQALEKAFE